jgi:adenine-specific DNA-methyltransferase
MAEIEKLDGKSMDIVEQNIEQLKELFPDVFSEGKIKFNQLEELLGNYVITDEDHYNFTWHGKRKAGRLAQTPSTGTLRPCRKESVDWDKTENLFIEGDNLEVLKLLQKSYHRQVKMIYIDPPYNTGNDFIYEDDFKDGVKNYLEMTGQLDNEGKKMGTNSSSAGRYHTNWLNMMYPRLKLARNLLKDDGVIFISIDDNEQSNLRKLCDEVFGEENFIGNIIWEKRYGRSNNAKLMTTSTEHILLFRKSLSTNLLRELRSEKHPDGYSNPDNDPRGIWTSVSFVNQVTREARPNLTYTITNPNTGKKIDHPTNAWKIGKDKYLSLLEGNRLHWGADGKAKYPRIKRFLSELDEGMVPVNFWKFKDAGTVDMGTKEVKNLMEIDAFTFPKPTLLIKKMLSLFNPNENANTERDIILDFFAGSGTTADAVMQLSSEDNNQRRWISVQIPEKVDKTSEASVAGYKNIADISKERIRRAGKKIKDDNPEYNGDLGFKVFKLDTSNIKRWEADFDTLEADLLGAVDYLVEGRSDEDVLYELCLKLGLDITMKIEEKTIAGKKVSVLGRGYLIVCLDNDITMDLVNGIGALKQGLLPYYVEPKNKEEEEQNKQSKNMRVIFKDDGFKDDVVKTNALQTLKRYGIEDIKSL